MRVRASPGIPIFGNYIDEYSGAKRAISRTLDRAWVATCETRPELLPSKQRDSRQSSGAAVANDAGSGRFCTHRYNSPIFAAVVQRTGPCSSKLCYTLEVNTKPCKRCGQEKETSQFSIKVRKTGELNAWCRSCHSDYIKRVWYPANKEKHLKMVVKLNQRYRLLAREFILAFLADKSCVDCGESDIRTLDFDHVRGRKTRDICTLIGMHSTTEKLEMEIKKCDIRCANCHRKRTSDNGGWFKSARVPALSSK